MAPTLGAPGAEGDEAGVRGGEAQRPIRSDGQVARERRTHPELLADAHGAVGLHREEHSFGGQHPHAPVVGDRGPEGDLRAHRATLGDGAIEGQEEHLVAGGDDDAVAGARGHPADVAGDRRAEESRAFGVVAVDRLIVGGEHERPVAEDQRRATDAPADGGAVADAAVADDHRLARLGADRRVPLRGDRRRAGDQPEPERPAHGAVRRDHGDACLRADEERAVGGHRRGEDATDTDPRLPRLGGRLGGRLGTGSRGAASATETGGPRVTGRDAVGDLDEAPDAHRSRQGGAGAERDGQNGEQRERAPHGSSSSPSSAGGSGAVTWRSS